MNEKYKASQFNVMVKLENGDLIIRNLFSNTYVLIEKSMVQEVNAILCETGEKNEKIKEILIGKGMLVPEEMTEYQQVDAYRRKISYSSENLDLTILPTDACNFKCAYCFESEGKSFMSGETESRLIKFMDLSFKKYKTVYIQWFGGEPLLCKNQIRRIMLKAKEFAKRDKVSLVAGITTNGYELDVETYKELCRLGLIWIQVSIDGTKEIHNLQRPHKTNNDSFDKIIYNLKNIKNLTLPGVCKIYYRITISKQTLPYIDEILQKYKEDFSADRRFCLSLQPVMDWGGTRIDGMREELPIVDDTIKCLLKASDLGLMPIGHHTQPSSGLICESIRENAYVVGPDNIVHACPMAIYNVKENDLYRGVIGELNENGKISITNWIQNEWMECQPVLGERCRKCKYYAICHGNVTCPYSSKFGGNLQESLCKKAIYDKYIPAEVIMKYRLGEIDTVLDNNILQGV